MKTKTHFATKFLIATLIVLGFGALGIHRADAIAFFADPSYNYEYADPSYGFDYAEPSYDFYSADSSYGYDYAEPSYDFYSADSSYTYDYTDPSYDFYGADSSYLYDYADPSYDYYSADPSYGFDYADPSYNYDYGYAYGDDDYDYTYTDYDDNYSYPNYNDQDYYDYPSYSNSCGSRCYGNDYQYDYGCRPSCGNNNPGNTVINDNDTSIINDNDVYQDNDTNIYNDNDNDDLDVVCIASDTSVDEGDTVRFEADVDGGDSPYRYNWNGSNISGSGRSVSARFNREGTFTVRVTVTDDDGQRASDDCVIHVDEEDNDNDNDDDLEVVCVASDTRIEEGDRVTFTARIDGGNSPYDYDWSGTGVNDDNDRSITVRYNRAGTYNVRVTVEDDDNDRDSDECTIRVENDNNVITHAPNQVASVSSVFLSQVPYTGPEDVAKGILFFVGLLAWSAAVTLYFMKRRGQKLQTAQIDAFKMQNMKSKGLA